MCPYQFPFHLTFRKLSTAILFYYAIRFLFPALCLYFICTLLYFLCKFTNYFPVYLVAFASFAQLGSVSSSPGPAGRFSLATGKRHVACGMWRLQLIAGIATATKQKSFWQSGKSLKLNFDAFSDLFKVLCSCPISIWHFCQAPKHPKT